MHRPLFDCSSASCSAGCLDGPLVMLSAWQHCDVGQQRSAATPHSRQLVAVGGSSLGLPVQHALQPMAAAGCAACSVRLHEVQLSAQLLAARHSGAGGCAVLLVLCYRVADGDDDDETEEGQYSSRSRSRNTSRSLSRWAAWHGCQCEACDTGDCCALIAYSITSFLGPALSV